MSSDYKPWASQSDFVRKKYGIGSEYEISWMGRDIDTLPDGPEGLEDDGRYLSLQDAIEKHVRQFKAPEGWLICGLFNSTDNSWIMAMISGEDYRRIIEEEKGDS